MKKVLLFGASGYGEKVYDILKDDFDVVAFVDNDPMKIGKQFLNKPVISPTKAIGMGLEIFICSSYSRQISEQLVELNYPNYKIIRLDYHKYAQYFVEKFADSCFLFKNYFEISGNTSEIEVFLTGIQNTDAVRYVLQYFLGTVSSEESFNCDLNKYIERFIDPAGGYSNTAKLSNCPKILLLLILNYYYQRDIGDYNFIKQILDYMILNGMHQQINVLKQFISCYLSRVKVDVDLKLFYYTILIYLKDSVSLEKMVEMIAGGQDNNYKFWMLHNAIGYRFRYSMPLTPNTVNLLRKTILELSQLFHKSHDNRERGHVSNVIVIITDHLAAITHSPTKVILDYAMNLSDLYPDKKIVIINELNFIFSNEFHQVPFTFEQFSGYATDWDGEEAKEYIKLYPNLEIVSSNLHLKKEDRIGLLLSYVKKLNPELIVTDSQISVLCRVLYESYPVIYKALLSKFEYINEADVYEYPSGYFSDKPIKPYVEEKVFVNKFITHPRFARITGSIQRNALGLTGDDFVMITVGTRLYLEVANDYIDLICSFIKNNPRAKWLIVGKMNFEYIQNNYGELLKNHIIHREFEKELLELFAICNVYLNPRRTGGGYSAIMAMYCGLPIVAYNETCDVCSHLGRENAVGEDDRSYLLEMFRLCNESSYYKFKSQLMQKLFRERFDGDTKRTITEIHSMAKRNFKQRVTSSSIY